jgi:hypothetical protein
MGNKLKDNQAGVNVIGGDNYGDTHINTENKKSPLREMIESLKEDCHNDPNFSGYIDELQHHITPKINNQKDLATKLKDSGRDEDDYIEDAELLKELFAKKLLRNNLSPSAQLAYAHLLAKIKSIFVLKIKPAIQEGKSIGEIDEKVFEKIVKDIYADVCGTKLDHTMDGVRGMLYFLTGNCHISWAADASLSSAV